MRLSHSTTTSLFERLCRILCLIGWLIQTSYMVIGFDKKNQIQRTEILKTIANNLLHALHIRLEHESAQPTATKPVPALIVANHVSWLDIFVLMAQCPGSFIAKQSIRHWPVIGFLARQIGVIFINRDSRSVINNINRQIEAALLRGQSVIFFPESRTSDGTSILPFKAALFESSIVTGSPVQAIALRFYDEQNLRTTKVAYVGKTNLFVSLWRIISIPEIKIKTDYAALIYPAADSNRYNLKKAAESFIDDKVNSDAAVQ